MPLILVASDAQFVHDEVATALVGPGSIIVAVTEGADVSPFVAERRPDLVIVDMQIGNMGGFAVAQDLLLEASAGRAPEVPILLLLDRQADTFLARRAEVAQYLVKPVDAGTLRRTVKQLLAGPAGEAVSG